MPPRKDAPPDRNDDGRPELKLGLPSVGTVKARLALSYHSK